MNLRHFFQAKGCTVGYTGPFCESRCSYPNMDRVAKCFAIVLNNDAIFLLVAKWKRTVSVYSFMIGVVSYEAVTFA